MLKAREAQIDPGDPNGLEGHQGLEEAMGEAGVLAWLEPQSRRMYTLTPGPGGDALPGLGSWSLGRASVDMPCLGQVDKPCQGWVATLSQDQVDVWSQGPGGSPRARRTTSGHDLVDMLRWDLVAMCRQHKKTRKPLFQFVSYSRREARVGPQRNKAYCRHW